jgi:hypothetical protein
MSTGPKFPDAKERSLAAANAGLARWREKMRAAKAAGLILKFPCGRKPGPSRRQRELKAQEREEALARRRVEFMDARAPPRWPARRGGPSFVKTLEGLERTLIARLSDRDPPSSELIEGVLNDILQGEEMFGRAVGKEERLACLSWAYENWWSRQALKKVLAELARERAARAAQARAVGSDEGTARPAPEQSPLAGSKAQAEAAEPLSPEDHAAIPMLSPELAAQYAAIDARAERRRLRWLELEAKRARQRERGVPRTMPGVHPRYRLP